jgi:hypothetical protein
MKIKGLEPEENRRLWQARLEELAESGLTQKQWCEQNSINMSALRYWIGRSKKEKRQQEESGGRKWLTVNTSAFTASNADAGSGGEIAVNYGAYRVEISEGTNPERIYNVLRVLKEL